MSIFSGFKKWFIFIPVLVTSASVYAREGCNRHCLEKIHSKINTLRAEVKSAVPVGSIVLYAGSGTLPEGYLICDGSLVSQVEYKALFQAIGFAFTPEDEQKGDQFRIPDLRGRVPVGRDNMGVGTQGAERVTYKKSGINGNELGSVGGDEVVKLKTAELPAHSHSATTGSSQQNLSHTHEIGMIDTTYTPGHIASHKIYRQTDIGTNSLSPNGPHGRSSTTPADLTHHTHSVTVGETGGSQAHQNMQPSIILNYMIKYSSEK